MVTAPTQRQTALDAAAFVGSTLGPLFLWEPAASENAALMKSLAALDPAAAAQEWPLVDAATAAPPLEALVQGATDPSTLTWEYRRLFVGPAPKAAPPWGSVYTDKDQVIFGRSTLDLRQWMRQVGVASRAGEGEPEDHIGLMLTMMAWLAQRKPEAMDEFLQLHFLTWAPHFFDTVIDATCHPFYGAAATLAKCSLAGIQTTLALPVKKPKFYR